MGAGAMGVSGADDGATVGNCTRCAWALGNPQPTVRPKQQTIAAKRADMGSTKESNLRLLPSRAKS